MKGIDLIKRMPLELQKEFAKEFVRQKSEKKLIEYLNKSFGFRNYDFHEFINDAFIWDRTKGKHYYWMKISIDGNYNSISLRLPKAHPAKTR